MDSIKKHQVEIAKKTLQIPIPILNVLGGITKEEAKKILKEINKK